MSERALVSIRREVPSQAEAPYRAAWAAWRDATRDAGAKAWRFHSAANPRQFIEFLEYPSSADPRSHPDVAEALARLDGVAPGRLEEWLPTPEIS